MMFLVFRFFTWPFAGSTFFFQGVSSLRWGKERMGCWYLKKIGIPFWFGLIFIPDIFGGAVPIISSYLLEIVFFVSSSSNDLDDEGLKSGVGRLGIFKSPWYPQNARILPCHHQSHHSKPSNSPCCWGSPFTDKVSFFFPNEHVVLFHTKKPRDRGWEWMVPLAILWVVETWWVTPSIFGSCQLFTASGCFFSERRWLYLSKDGRKFSASFTKKIGLKECFCRSTVFF